jgi:hypothetical protein
MPAPAVSGAMVRCMAVSWSSAASMIGQTCTQTWFMSSGALRLARRVRARRMPSTQFAMARSTCGNEFTRSSSSRTTASSRTCASATSRWSDGLSFAMQW